MKEAEIAQFRSYLETNFSSFQGWGEHVATTIEAGLRSTLGDSAVSNFLRIPAIPRVKTVKSAIDKIIRKGYSDPSKQMTDLVGVRFVVLLQEQMKNICDLIEAEQTWTAIRARDPESEMKDNPKFFDYQSVHYVVLLKGRLEINGKLVSSELACEIQVRTLLQHAYAEMVHDSIYKPAGSVPPRAERLVARSMALMETTDELFSNTMKILSEENKPRNDLLVALSSLFSEITGVARASTNDNLNLVVLDTYRDLLPTNTIEKIRSLLESKRFVLEKVRERSARSVFFNQPISLLAYMLASSLPVEKILDTWPLPGALDELELIFSDLGISVH